MDSVEQIVPKSAFLHEFFEIFVGGGDDSDIDLDGDLAPDRIELPLLQDTQQFRLSRERHVADLIEKECPAVSLSKKSPSAFNRAGESPFLMAEEFALQ